MSLHLVSLHQVSLLQVNLQVVTLGAGASLPCTATWAPPPSLTHLPAFQGIPIQQQLGIVGVNKMQGTVSKEVGKAESQEAKKR